MPWILNKYSTDRDYQNKNKNQTDKNQKIGNMPKARKIENIKNNQDLLKLKVKSWAKQLTLIQ